MGVHDWVTGMEIAGATLLGIGGILTADPAAVAAAMALIEAAEAGAVAVGAVELAEAVALVGEATAAVDAAGVIGTGLYGADTVASTGAGLMLSGGAIMAGTAIGAGIPIGGAPGHPTDTDMPNAPALPTPGSQVPTPGADLPSWHPSKGGATGHKGAP